MIADGVLAGVPRPNPRLTAEEAAALPPPTPEALAKAAAMGPPVDEVYGEWWSGAAAGAGVGAITGTGVYWHACPLLRLILPMCRHPPVELRAPWHRQQQGARTLAQAHAAMVVHSHAFVPPLTALPITDRCLPRLLCRSAR